MVRHREKTDQIQAGAVLSFVQMVLGMLLVLTYTPIMIRQLGQSEYGLYNTAWSTAYMLSILSLGFNSGYIRYYTRYKQRGDEASIARLNGLFLIIFTIIGAVALVCGLYVTEHLELIFDAGLTEQEYGIARILMLLLTLHMAIGFPASVFSSIISAHERFIVLRILDMGKNVLAPLLTIPVLFAGGKSVSVVLITLLVSLAVNAAYVFYVFVILKNRFVFHGFEEGIFKSLFIYTVFIAINLIIDQVNGNIDKLLLGRFHGTSSVAVYSAGFTLYNYVVSALLLVSGVFTPWIHRIVEETREEEKEQRKRLTELFVKVGRIQFMLLALLCTGFVFWGEAFIVKFWAGPGYEEAYEVALLLLLPGSIALVQDLGIEIQRALNRHRFRSIVYSVMAVINLALTVWLCKSYGAVGAAVGTAISFLLCNGIVMNIYYHLRCNLDIICFWKHIGSVAKGLILPIAAGIALHAWVEVDSVARLILVIFIYVLVYGFSMWLFGMNGEEKEMLLKPVRRFCKMKDR
ncbi:MAG: oligosaccharide flippase family protein [Roseburia sp.]|nr:oligosaccharide flippase family protein [Roseburia sp.]